MKFDPIVLNPESDLLEATVSELKARAKAYQPTDTGNTGGDNAVYGFTSTKHIRAYAFPCHANMGAAPLNETAHVWSVFCKPQEALVDPAILKDHFDWLVNESISPWRQLLAIEPPQKSGRATLNNPKFQWNYGFVFSNLKNLPANLLMNFLVATRMPKEWPGTIIAWHNLVHKYKCDPAMAYFFIRMFAATGNLSYDPHDRNVIGADEKKKFRINTANWYDWPLDTATSDMEYVYNFVTGQPVYAEKDGFACGRHQHAYRKINNCWGKSVTISDPSSYPLFLFTTYATKFGGKFKSTGLAFAPREGISEWHLTLPEVVAIIHAEYERIMAEYASNRQAA